MSDPGIHVSREFVENFSRELLPSDPSPLDRDGSTKRWLDKAFLLSGLALITYHDWLNYLTIFFHESSKVNADRELKAAREVAMRWFFDNTKTEHHGGEGIGGY